MDIQQNRKGPGQFLIAAVVAAALGGCATAREQPPVASANVAAAPPEAAQLFARPAKARPVVTRAASSSPASSKKTTAAILAQVHQATLREIAMGEIAQVKASTSEVRAYADQLLQDQSNADQTVVAMAQKTGANLRDAAARPREGRHESAKRKLLEQRLNSASGAGFDRLFLQQTSSDHERLIRTLQQDREDASDDEIEALIDQMIPILEQDQKLAQILMKKEPV